MTIVQPVQIRRLMPLVSLWSIEWGILCSFLGRYLRHEASPVRLETGQPRLVALHI
jgi:hypothetical protein